jgi:hypothetical protein
MEGISGRSSFLSRFGEMLSPLEGRERWNDPGLAGKSDLTR